MKFFQYRVKKSKYRLNLGIHESSIPGTSEDADNHIKSIFFKKSISIVVLKLVVFKIACLPR